jgi:hypothetical protein
MKLARKIIFLIILAGIFLCVSGCISLQKGATSQPTPSIPSPGTTSPRYLIQIDPIKDFKTDSTFNITGSTTLNVTGTTDFPAGTTLNLYIIEEKKSRNLIRTTITIKHNNSGPNSFTYQYDIKGNPPGKYRVIISDSINLNGEFSSFNIISDNPYEKWIQMDPLGKVQQGGILSVSGTTDLPAGSEIMVQAKIDGHSCTMATPDRFGARSLCGGSCRDTGSQKVIPVVVGTSGINIWNSTVDTSAWCPGEGYVVGAYAVNWTNVTPGGKYFRL